MTAPLIDGPGTTLPPGASAEFVTAPDGGRIRIVRFPIPSDRVGRGTVLVHPGWSEFAEKYAEVAADLHRRGFGVIVLDPRGQGFSQRLDGDDRRGHIDDFAKFVTDLTTTMDHVRATEAGPYGILAHSMGGLITLQWLAQGRGKDLSAVVLSAPLTNLFRSPFKAAFVKSILTAGKLLGRGTAPLPGVQEHSWAFEGNVLTQDADRHERFRQLQLANPSAVAGLPKFDWLAAALGGMKHVQAPGALKGVNGPILLVSAARDETVDPIHHGDLAAQYPDLFDYKSIPGARHELLMEADEYRDAFFAAFDQYMDDRMPPVSAEVGSSAASSVPLT